MKIRNLILSCALVLGLAASCVTVARAVDPYRHPNLAEAQSLIAQAIDRVTAAQQANEYDMNGHAARAKDLLMQANHEIQLAARAANRNGH
jgi:hypothetical protein